MKWCMWHSIAVVALLAAIGCIGVFAGCGKHTAASPVVVDSGTSGAASPRQDDGSQEETVPRSEVKARVEAANAPAAQPKRGQPPPADRTPSRPGEAEKITFDDLNLGMQADVVFRPHIMIPEGHRVKELEGKAISIAGYMHGAQLSQRGIAKFVLLKNTECKFGPGGQADHLAQVILREGTTTVFTNAPVKVEGILKVVPFEGVDGNTWAIYNLEEARIR